MERKMWVVKHPKTGHYLRVVTRVVHGKAVHEACWVENITFANRSPEAKAAQMMFMCSAKQLGQDYCEIQEVLVTITEVE